MSASIFESLFLGAVLLFGLLSLAVLTGGFLLWRSIRRRILAFRSHGAVVGATAVWEATRSRRGGRPTTPVTATDFAEWSANRARRELWGTVDRAASAVRTADAMGSPTAELPSLCRRLQAAATDIDKVLRVDPSAPVPDALCDPLAEIFRAAEDVQRAATTAASEVSAERVRALSEDAGAELTLLDAGLASMRTTGTPRTPRLPR